MKFSREYTKLQDRVFTTVREGDYYRVGQVIDCRPPEREFQARLLLKVQIRFRDIPEAFLQYDTDCPELSAAEIRNKIRSFYRRNAPRDDWIMTIYWLERMEVPDASKLQGGRA